MVLENMFLQCRTDVIGEGGTGDRDTEPLEVGITGTRQEPKERLPTTGGGCGGRLERTAGQILGRQNGRCNDQVGAGREQQ